MLKMKDAFSTIAVPDLDVARDFYGKKLGIDVSTEPDMGMLELHVGQGAPVTVYPKPDHKPAVFTVLNFVVDDIDAAVSQLNDAGITMQRYDVDGGMKADDKGIYRGEGPAIAWFTDPAGNILSVIQQ